MLSNVCWRDWEDAKSLYGRVQKGSQDWNRHAHTINWEIENIFGRETSWGRRSVVEALVIESATVLSDTVFKSIWLGANMNCNPYALL